MAIRTIRAEMAGTIIAVERQAGETVAAGDIIVVMESMKMEMPMVAPVAGTVSEILVSEGDVVAEEQPLARLS